MENACWTFSVLFRSVCGNVFQRPGPRSAGTETEQCYCSLKETYILTNKKQVLRFNNLQKYSALMIRQDIILAIFTTSNDDD